MADTRTTDLIRCESCGNAIPSDLLKEFGGDCPWCMSKPDAASDYPPSPTPFKLEDHGVEEPAEVKEAPDAARFGRFIRVKILGAGGMGEVWKAWDPALRRWVALKFLKTTDARDRAWFQREAHVAATLSHPHIAAIHDIGEDQGLQYIAMQFVEGRNLESHRPASHHEIATIMRDAARGVAHAHDSGIIHRDLKPANFMVTDAGHVYVMDFGLARRIDSSAANLFPSEAAGTPVYMSPEQARGAPLDARADVYSLGATMYELLSGKAPYDPGPTHEMLKRAMASDAPPLQVAAPLVPAELASIAMKCLSKNRDDRYASATELADDLDRWLVDFPVTAHSSGPLYRASKFLRRHWIVTAALLVAIAIACAVTVIYERERRVTAEVERWSWSAERLLSEEKYREAAEIYSRIIALRPSAKTYLSRSFAHAELGNLDESLNDCQRAVELEPLNQAAIRTLDRARAELEGGRGD